ncbi:MAG: methyltransferase domain-containing protein [Sedimentisphaerales bacterium]|nr:methyltransferase domain-containing protein [Sedimentisphaerales bacterium]
MIGQIWRLIRLLGLSRAVRMKRHHQQGLSYVRGYAATCCWWTLLQRGFLDRLAAEGPVSWRDHGRRQGWDEQVLAGMVEYLDGIGLLARRDEQVELTDPGRVLLAEPRGLIELLWAYEPCLANLPDMLTGRKQYGRDLQRRITYVGLGSGRLCEQLPYPVMRRMVLGQKARTVLDLGCGDLAFLAGLCRVDPEIRCHGIDFSPEMVQFDRDQLAKNDYQGRLTVQVGDMFDLPDLPADLPPVDCITACDTFHEYLQETPRLLEMFRSLRARFPTAVYVIGEFCLQDPAWLKKHPTASLEHHLFHQLSNQQIGSADQWRGIFRQAGLEIIAEQIYDLVGHGYFALRAAP